MPELRGLTVHVTTTDGKEFPEWGTQYLKKANKVTTYIQSATNVAFRLSCAPNIPYIDIGTPAIQSCFTRHRGALAPEDCSMKDQWQHGDVAVRPKEDSLHSESPDRLSSESTKQEPTNRCFKSDNSPTKLKGVNVNPPDFHFMASLYIDGRTIPERSLIIYLDPDHEEFSDHGKVWFKTRRVSSKDGQLLDQAWIFKDVGIESVFDKLFITVNEPSIEHLYLREEDQLLEAMSAAQLDEKASDMKKDGVTGTIVVKISRVTLGEKYVDLGYESKHKEEDAHMGDAGEDVSHNTGLSKGRRRTKHGVSVVPYNLYKPEEGEFAQFTFFYRSEDILQKFNFPNFPTRRRDLKRLPPKYIGAYLTPLGWLNPPKLPKITCAEGKGISFEDKIAAGDLRKEEMTDDSLERILDENRYVMQTKLKIKRRISIKKEELDGSTSPSETASVEIKVEDNDSSESPTNTVLKGIPLAVVTSHTPSLPSVPLKHIGSFREGRNSPGGTIDPSWGLWHYENAKSYPLSNSDYPSEPLDEEVTMNEPNISTNSYQGGTDEENAFAGSVNGSEHSTVRDSEYGDDYVKIEAPSDADDEKDGDGSEDASRSDSVSDMDGDERSQKHVNDFSLLKNLGTASMGRKRVRSWSIRNAKWSEDSNSHSSGALSQPEDGLKVRKRLKGSQNGEKVKETLFQSRKDY